MHAYKYLALLGALYSISGVCAGILSPRVIEESEAACKAWPPNPCTTNPDNCCGKSSCWVSDHVRGMDSSAAVREI